MSRIKEHYWDEITNDYEVFEALHYQSTIWNVVELIQQYSMQTVLSDIIKNLESKEVK